VGFDVYSTKLRYPIMAHHSTRRGFVGRTAAGLVLGGSRAPAQSAGRVRGFDHVALPMKNTDAMLAFYRGLGFPIRETETAVSVYAGDQMINFHRPAHWNDAAFTLRAPAAKPPCGDLCFVWEGLPDALKAMLDRAGATVFLGPVARQGGRMKTASSVYVRDPDGNLLEFMIYP
jgi:catechol 2,3-dioxygenase-like lactoylglutathione lyase family enzyme